MAEALKSTQRTDGFWNVSLADPTEFPGPETSGTAFFVYGLAWGINNGILDKETYLPTVIKGWNGLTSTALTSSGRIGYAQGVADEPKDAQPVTINSSREYGEGNFLLAGTEVIQLAEGDMPIPHDFFVKNVEVVDISTLKINFFEPVKKTYAENTANYQINNNVVIDNAILSVDGMSCLLTISNIYMGGYGISFNNIESVSGRTIGDGSGKYFWFNHEKTTSLNSHPYDEIELFVYPNPAGQDHIYIKPSAFIQGKVLVQVFDTDGKLILTKRLVDLNVDFVEKLNLHGISKGIYILNIRGSRVNINKKFAIH